jgi:hypothetical protein
MTRNIFIKKTFVWRWIYNHEDKAESFASDVFVTPSVAAKTSFLGYENNGFIEAFA